jgi:acetyltransferase-like isoleucine patch superfamily enzyme
MQVLAECHKTVVVEFGTLFSQSGAVLEENVYIGPRCHLGLVHIEKDVLIGPAVHVPSGAQTHGTDDLTKPIREQSHQRTLVRIGAGAWIGSAAIVMADVGKNTVVGAGAVVTKPVPDNVVAAGVPAKVIRQR